MDGVFTLKSSLEAVIWKVIWQVPSYVRKCSIEQAQIIKGLQKLPQRQEKMEVSHYPHSRLPSVSLLFIAPAACPFSHSFRFLAARVTVIAAPTKQTTSVYSWQFPRRYRHLVEYPPFIL